MTTTPVAEFDAVVSGDIYVLAPKSDTGFQPVTKDKESYRQDACCTIQQGFCEFAQIRVVQAAASGILPMSSAAFSITGETPVPRPHRFAA